MAEEQRSVNNVVPVLVAVLVCDVATLDPGSGKKSLIGIFDRLNVKNFPTKRPMSIYIKLADAQGKYDVAVRLVQRETNDVLTELEGALEVTDRLTSVDFFLTAPPLPFPREGRYEFQVWANQVYLGAAMMDAHLRNP
jgi:hypothetical protein